MKKTFCILVALLLSFSLFAGGASESGVDNSLNDVLEKGQFVLGLDDSFPPMGYRDENGEIVGFDIDCAREVCNRLGVELVPQPIDWNSKEQELMTGNIDCLWNGFTITEERKENPRVRLRILPILLLQSVRSYSSRKTSQPLWTLRSAGLMPL